MSKENSFRSWFSLCAFLMALHPSNAEHTTIAASLEGSRLKSPGSGPK
jgi:hypothetical protein